LLLLVTLLLQGFLPYMLLVLVIQAKHKSVLYTINFGL